MMRTIETTAVVGADHTITLKLPDDVPEGTVKVVVTLPGTVTSKWADWPAHHLELLNPNETFRREDMYGDDGR